MYKVRVKAVSRQIRIMSITVLAALLLASSVAVVLAEPYVSVVKWGSIGDGDGEFTQPAGVAVDNSGNVYVADYGNNRIQKFTSNGVFITKWGDKGYDDGQFRIPVGVAVDNSGNVYVADQDNSRIQKFTDCGVFVTKWGTFGDGDGQFNNPTDVAVDNSGNVYVADNKNGRIQKFTGDGVFVTKMGTFGDGDGQFGYPWGPLGVAVDNSGNVYTTDIYNGRIQKFADSGVFVTTWGSYGLGDGQFRLPVGVAVDSSGNVYVADYGNDRIQIFTDSGVFLDKWGSRGSLDGQFIYPWGVAVDSSGNVYVADMYNHRIQKFPIPPVILPVTTLTIGNPQFVSDANYVTENTPLTLHANAASGIVLTQYRILGESYDSGLITYTSSFYLDGLEDGSYSIEFMSVDTLGHIEQTKIVDVYLDNSVPVTTLAIGQPQEMRDGLILVKPGTPFALEMTDEGSDVASSQYRVFNETYDSDWKIYEGLIYWNTLDNGTYSIEFMSVDNLGNIEQAQTAQFEMEGAVHYITVTSTHDNPTSSKWVDEGGSYTVSVNSPTEVVSSNSRWVCTGFSVDGGAYQLGTSFTFTEIVGDHSIDFAWKQQYYLTANNPSWPATVGGRGWYDSGTTAFVTVTPLVVTTGGTRFNFTGWSGDASGLTSPSNPIIMDGPKTALTNWIRQYYLTVSSARGTVSGGGWYDSGSSAYAFVNPLTVADSAGTQYVFNSWSGSSGVSGTTSPSNAIVMNGPKTAIANWRTQYYLTVTSDHGTVGGSGWYNAGASAYATVSPLTVTGSTGIQYVFTGWSGSVSGTTSPSNAITMNGPKTVTANWKTQFELSSISPAQLWLGLKNSDDVGIKFDLKADVYLNGVLIGNGSVNSVAGGSSGFNNAKLDNITISLFDTVWVSSGDNITVSFSVRNAAIGSGKNSGTARLWYDSQAANTCFNATIGDVTSRYFVHGDFTSNTSVGTLQKTIDVAAGAKGSAFKQFGSWSLIVP